MEQVQQFLASGGITSWLIVLSALILLVLASERFFILYVRLNFDSKSSLEKVRQLILQKQYAQAIQVCNMNQSDPIVSVAREGLVAVENGREAMKSAIGSAIIDVNNLTENRMSYISLIAGIATLLGLLGTITGLIKTFAALAAADAAQKAELLGGGISEAMYSTASGLAVGITAMIVHTVCSNKIDRITGEAQNTGYRLVTWVEESERVR